MLIGAASGASDPMNPNPFDRLREALQYLLDCQPDSGWQLSHYVVVLGLQRMDSDLSITNASWIAVPTDQPDYVTTGLLADADPHKLRLVWMPGTALVSSRWPIVTIHRAHRSGARSTGVCPHGAYVRAMNGKGEKPDSST